MRRLVVTLVIGLVVLAGCGGDDDGDDAGVETETTAAGADDEAGDDAGDEAAGGTEEADTDVVVATADTDLGTVLVGPDGRTLYLFTNDSEGTSACTGQCASVWPPLTVTGDPVAGDGVDQAKLGTITRDDGTVQVTYNGHPLYYYAPDQGPGDTTGQGVNDVWFVVDPDGEAIEEVAASTGY